MISHNKKSLTEGDVTLLLQDKQYDDVVKGLNQRTIDEITFMKAFRKVFGYYIEDPKMADCFEALFSHSKISKDSIRIVSRCLYNRMLLETTNHDAVMNLLERLYDKDKSPICLYGLLGMLARPKIDKYVMDFSSRYNDVERKTLLQQLLPFVVYKCNASLFQALIQKYNIDIENVFSGVEDENIKMLRAQARLLAKLEPEKHDEIVKIMSEFVEEFGEIKYQNGLLTCAQIRENKHGKYLFNPTVFPKVFIDIESAFGEYLDILKDIPLPARERFIATGSHWFIGDIYVDQNKNIHVYVVDSLGDSSITFCDSFSKALRIRFPDSDINIYYAYEKRQYSQKGCSAFSIDDLRQLFTLNKFLTGNASGSGIFGYLSENLVSSRQGADEKIHIHRCKTPLKLMRSLQSKSLLSEVIPSRPQEEQDSIVSGKGKTAGQSVSKYFVDDVNQRTWQKLTVNLAHKNAMYLLSHDSETIKANKEDFTIAGFKRRVAEMKAEAGKRLSPHGK